MKEIKTSGRLREVVDEINADIASYSSSYRQLMFLVYDLGHIREWNSDTTLSKAGMSTFWSSNSTGYVCFRSMPGSSNAQTFAQMQQSMTAWFERGAFAGGGNRVPFRSLR